MILLRLLIFRPVTIKIQTRCNIARNAGNRCCKPWHMLQCIAHNVAKIENDPTSARLPSILCAVALCEQFLIGREMHIISKCNV